MTEKCRFFDSTIEQERTYSAKDFAEYFAALVTDGVFAEQLNALQVTADGATMTTTVDTGKAFIKGYYYENDAPLGLTHDAADPISDRIDRIVLRLDLVNRTLNAVIIKGTPDASPVAPAITRDENIYDVPLAQVRITAGQSYISTDAVTDEREYARYTSKPAWYPEGHVPEDAYMYLLFKNELTTQEISDIEANASLMSVINDSSIPKSALGSYVGDGTTNRFINVGFTPSCIICGVRGFIGTIVGDINGYTANLYNSGSGTNGSPISYGIVKNGFLTGSRADSISLNALDTVYYYYALGV